MLCEILFFLRAFQLKTGIDTYTLKNEVLLRNIKKLSKEKRTRQP